MKKILILLFSASIILLLSGCQNNLNDNNSVNIIYREKTESENKQAVIVTIYEDTEYKYFMYDSVAYVEYKGQQLGYEEALSQGIVTIDDLYEAGAKIEKEKK